MAWYFTCTSLLSYFFADAVNWGVYYVFVYGVVVVGLVVAGIVGVVRLHGGGSSGENPRGKSETENMSDFAWVFWKRSRKMSF